MQAEYNYKILGHRGYGKEDNHNSLEAFRKATKSKMQGIELDVTQIYL